MKKIKAGTKVFATQLGHNGFHYPSDDSIIASEDAVVNLLPWVTSKDDGRLPVTIENLEGVSFTAWIKKSDLLDS